MVDLLSKIICRSSDIPLKSELLTFRSILKISAGEFEESFDFPRISLRKGMLLRSMIRGKFSLSANYPAERHVLPQDSSQKLKTLRGFYCGKACLTQNNSRLQAFPRFIPRKSIFLHEYLRKFATKYETIS
jgi:hypothetical protein